MEKYLRKCIDSIINQSFKNIEIILVNDGSTDSSKLIVDEYMQKDNRIIAVHKDNGGIGSAYESGLQKVSGDYISFIDSDDYIDTEMYAELSEIAIKENADIIQFGMYRINNEGYIYSKELPGYSVIEGNDSILLHHFKSIKTPSLACRIFKSHLLSDIKFLPISLGVDETTIIQVITKCKKQVLINKAYYYVYERTGSVSRELINEKKLRDGMMVHRFINDYIMENKKEYVTYAIMKYLKYLMGEWIAAKRNKEILNSRELKEARSDFKHYYNSIKSSKQLKSEKIIFRLKLLVFDMSPNIFFELRSLLKLLNQSKNSSIQGGY